MMPRLTFEVQHGLVAEEAFPLVPKLQPGNAMVFEALLHWALAPGE